MCTREKKKYYLIKNQRLRVYLSDSHVPYFSIALFMQKAQVMENK